jgi:hypothetical protein
MTTITFQDGKVVLRDGKVGTEQACCCQGGQCCGGYTNCQVTYTVTLSTGQVINGTGYLPVTENQDVSDAVDSQLAFDVVGRRFNGECTLTIAWLTEYMCDFVDFDIVGFFAYRIYRISCQSCCETDPEQDGFAYNCSFTEIEGGTIQEPECPSGVENLGVHVTNVVINSITCDPVPCGPCPGGGPGLGTLNPDFCGGYDFCCTADGCQPALYFAPDAADCVCYHEGAPPFGSYATYAACCADNFCPDPPP